MKSDDPEILASVIADVEKKSIHLANQIQAPFSQGVQYISICRGCIEVQNNKDLLGEELIEPIDVDMKELQAYGADAVDKAQVGAQAMLAEKEDSLFFKSVEKYAKDTTAIFSTNFDGGNIIMRAVDYRIVREKIVNTNNVCNFDPVTRRELLKTGLMGTFIKTDTKIRLTKLITIGKILDLPKPEVLGVMYASQILITPGKDVTYEAKETVRFVIN